MSDIIVRMKKNLVNLSSGMFRVDLTFLEDGLAIMYDAEGNQLLLRTKGMYSLGWNVQQDIGKILQSATIIIAGEGYLVAFGKKKTESGTNVVESCLKIDGTQNEPMFVQEQLEDYAYSLSFPGVTLGIRDADGKPYLSAIDQTTNRANLPRLLSLMERTMDTSIYGRVNVFGIKDKLESLLRMK